MQTAEETRICVVTQTATATSSSSLLKSSSSASFEPPLKRIKLEGHGEHITTSCGNKSQLDDEKSTDVATVLPEQQLSTGVIAEKASPGMVSAGNSSAVSATTESNESLAEPLEPLDKKEVIPLKATHFRHLRHKYLNELEYMLKEFQKLERQLLGAKNGAGESAGSRERREKLRSFISHLEETVQQVIHGCELEAAGKSTCPAQPGDTALSTHLGREKEEEENVQKIEEHILANLLPVKVRLKKQLAAQQGAKHNPAGMPPVRGGQMQPDASKQGKATFLKAVPESPSQFGQPLKGGGSSLTQKLHGPTLGSSNRVHGQGVGQTKPEDAASQEQPVAASLQDTEKSKILYGGMAPGSKQIQSSVSAAKTVHKLVIRNPALLEMHSELHAAVNSAESPTSADTPIDDLKSWISPGAIAAAAAVVESGSLPEKVASAEAPKEESQLSSIAKATILSYEEGRKQRKKRRKKKKLLREQQALAAAQEQQQQRAPKRKKGGIPKTKRGPRNVEYICALCNEVYNSTCDYNPWWALLQHECPKCRKMQIPRVDISAPSNAIEYHPALLAHADENGGPGGAAAVVLPPPAQLKAQTNTDALDSDLSDDDGLLSDDDSIYTSDSGSEDFPSLTPADRAEREKFGLEYQGPKLSDKDSARLLTLMLHASTCPCR